MVVHPQQTHSRQEVLLALHVDVAAAVVVVALPDHCVEAAGGGCVAVEALLTVALAARTASAGVVLAS